MNEELIPYFLKEKMITWILSLLNESQKRDIHIFCLDFCSALLANIMSAKCTNDYLAKEKNNFFATNVFIIFIFINFSKKGFK